MAFWKQLLISAVLLVVAIGLWGRFYPGAGETLEGWGLHWVAATVSQGDRTARQDDVDGPGDHDAGGGFGGPPLVVTEEIGEATVNDRLTAIGTGRALRSVSVTPFVSGRLSELHVRSGTHVEQGDSIGQLDSEVEEIAVDRARFALEDAEARLQRIQALRSSNTATAVQETEAQLAVSNARLELRDAELALERRTIVAPIAGMVGILPVSEGNYVTQQTEIATIDDRSEIMVEFWVPERFAGMISVEQELTATSVARPADRFTGQINAVDNRIDADSRTLRVQARIENPDDILRAGMSFQVSMRFPGDTYPTIDPLAIQWGSDGPYVWLEQDGKAQRMSITIIQRGTERVLVSGDFGASTSVVTQGVHGVREGVDLRIVGRDEIAPEDGERPQAHLSH